MRQFVREQSAAEQRRRIGRRLVTALLFALLPLPALADGDAGGVRQQHDDQGIAIDFETRGDDTDAPVEFRFALSDKASGRPISGIRPAAWLGLREGKAAPGQACKQRIANYLAGDLFHRADVDLNSYFVLAMNDEASISVVDPLFGFGGSKLLALLTLEQPGLDWQLTPERERLFVSMPAAGKVAVADTRLWKVEQNVATGPNPRQLRQNDDYIWVADDTGLTRIDRRSLAVQRIALGAVRAIELDARGERLAALAGPSLVIVDAHSAAQLARLELPGQPQQLAYSSAAQAFYALDSAAGQVYAVDLKTTRLRGQIAVESGASQLRFAPDGRHALLPNPQRNRLQVLDAASNTIVQNADIAGAPDQVAFTPLQAYVRRRGSEIVQLIALDQLGRAGQPLNVAEFPAGQNPLGPAPADGGDSIVAAPEGPAVLVANAADKMIYLYREGMAAPAGGLRNYGRVPRALLVVDHGLREGRRGEYTARMPVPKAGSYDVALFADSPRIASCFSLEITDKRPPPPAPARVIALNPPAQLKAGAPAELRFALLDGADGQRRSGADVHGLAFLAPGIWQNRSTLAAAADGSYALRFTPPEAGLYYVWIEAESLGLTRRHNQFLVYEAK